VQNSVFLRESSPYHAYYEQKIQEFTEKPKEGEVELKQIEVKPSEEIKAEEEKKDSIAIPTSRPVDIQQQQSVQIRTETVKKASVMAPIAKAALNKPKEPPSVFEFLTNHPLDVSALDVDVIKLTAQYTAVSGREFLRTLAQREHRNPQFDFLKPTHMLFSYFTTLVDEYAKILQPTEDLMKKVDGYTNPAKTLEKCVHRWEWVRIEEERKKQAQAEADAERLAFQLVDWHDFVVAETIDFLEDEEFANFGFTANDDMDVDMDLYDGTVQPPSTSTHSMAFSSKNQFDDHDDDQIQVVSDYKPMISGGQQQPLRAIDPTTNQEMDLDKLPAHLKISMLNPKWLEEKEKFMQKQKESSIATGREMAATLQSLSADRGDIFGTVEEEERQLLEEAEKKKRRIEETKRIIWDGHSASVQAVQAKSMQKLMESIVNPLGEGESKSQGQLQTSKEKDKEQIGPAVPKQIQQPQVVKPSVLPTPIPTTFPVQTFPSVRPIQMPGIIPQIPSMLPTMVPTMQPTLPQFQFPQYPQAEIDGQNKNPLPPLIPEKEFAETISGIYTLSIRVPLDKSNEAWDLNGQMVSFDVDVMMTIKQIKEKLSEILGGMPPNKQQLKNQSQGFLKDNFSLAYYNIGPDANDIELLVRSRGGRR